MATVSARVKRSKAAQSAGAQDARGKTSKGGNPNTKTKRQTIEANELIIRDADGKPRMVFSVDTMKNPDGSEAKPIPASRRNIAALDFLDSNGRKCMRLGCRENGEAWVAIFNANGSTEALLTGGGPIGSSRSHLFLGNSRDGHEGGHLRLYGDGQIDAKGPDAGIEVCDKSGNTVFETHGRSAVDNSSYRVAIVTRPHDFEPTTAWDHPETDEALIGANIVEFLDDECEFKAAMDIANGFNHAALRDEVSKLWAVVIPPGAPASVGEAVWCCGLVYGGR